LNLPRDRGVGQCTILCAIIPRLKAGAQIHDDPELATDLTSPQVRLQQQVASPDRAQRRREEQRPGFSGLRQRAGHEFQRHSRAQTEARTAAGGMARRSYRRRLDVVAPRALGYVRCSILTCATRHRASEWGTLRLQAFTPA